MSVDRAPQFEATSNSKPAIIHCIRHAQGYHNLGVEFHNLLDPKLTPAGEEQVQVLRQSLGDEFLSRINLVTASPLSRTLHTAAIGFKPILRPVASDAEADRVQSPCKPDIFAIPDAQEISDFPCDTGSDPEVLEQACREHKWPADLSLIHPGWNKKTMTNRWSPRDPFVQARARDTRKLLHEKVQELRSEGVEEPEVVLVAHGGLMHYLTQDWEGASANYGTGWRNCEMRSYNFAEELDNRERARYEDGQPEQVFFVESSTSRQRRGLLTPMPGREEQKKLFREAMRGWEGQNLQTPEIMEREWQKGHGKRSQSGTARIQIDASGDMEEIKRTLSGGSEGSAPRVRVTA